MLTEKQVNAPVPLPSPPSPPPGGARAGSLRLSDTPLPTMPDLVAAVQSGRRWYYENNGSQAGPVEESALRQMVAWGQLVPQVMVWNEELTHWTPATEVPGLLAPESLPMATIRAIEDPAADDLPEGVVKTARDARPWVLFLAVTAFVYAVIWILQGFLAVAGGAEKGVPLIVAGGIFSIITGAVVGVGGMLLLNYAGRLSSLNYSKKACVLESALKKLNTFWAYVGVVLVVLLAFLLFFVIWLVALGSSLSRL